MLPIISYLVASIRVEERMDTLSNLIQLLPKRALQFGLFKVTKM